jgi:hypothetical protein
MFIVTTAAPLLTQPVISVTNVTTVSAQINLITAATGAASLTYFLTVTANPGAPLPASIIYFVDTFPYTVSALVPGTPYAFTLQATETATNIYRSAPSVSQQITTGSGSLAITTASPLPGATVGTAYGSVVAASGGTTPYRSRITAATPNTGSWLTINASTGVLTGIPGTVETESVTVEFTDAIGQTASKTFSLTVAGSGTAFLTYLKSLIRSGKMLSGQASDYYAGANSGPYGGLLDQFTGTTPANATITNTNKCPAIIGVNFGDEGTNLGEQTTAAQNVKLAQDWISAGGIVQIHWVPPNPTAYQYAPGSTNPFPSILTAGTPYYNALFHGTGQPGASGSYRGLDQVITELKQISGPVYFRVLPEGDLGNYWWYGTNGVNPAPSRGNYPTNAQYVALYKMVVDYMRAAGVANVLYCYNVNWFSGAFTNNDPGSSYRNLFGIDFYSSGSASSGLLTNNTGYNNLVGIDNTIPIVLCEAGSNGPSGNPPTNSGDNSEFDNSLNTSCPNIVGAVIFCQGFQLSNQRGAATYMSNTITRDQLPVLT